MNPGDKTSSERVNNQIHEDHFLISLMRRSFAVTDIEVTDKISKSIRSVPDNKLVTDQFDELDDNEEIEIAC